MRFPLGLPLTAGFGLLLAGFWGCLSIYNAKAFGEYPLHFAGRQLGWLALGAGVFLIASRIPFYIYRCLAPYAACASLGILLFLLEFGASVNGMRGWFSLAEGNVLLQPSEFTKTPFLLALCVIATSGSSWRRRFLLMGGLTLAFVMLVGLQPDYGTATMYFIGFGLIYWLAGGELLYAFLALALFGVFSVGFILANDYAMARIVGFYDPSVDALGYGWHIRQFQYTMAHGGLFGSNWGNALWSNAFLPLPHSDSVFASIVESAGFAGGMLVMGGFLALAFASYELAKKAVKDDARLFIFGVGAFVAAQALIHIGVNSTMIPPTGITLPILSYGGSSLVSTLFAFGVALSACKEKEGDGEIHEIAEGK